MINSAATACLCFWDLFCPLGVIIEHQLGHGNCHKLPVGRKELQSESAETPGAKVAKGGIPVKLPDSEGFGSLVFRRGSRSKESECLQFFPILVWV